MLQVITKRNGQNEKFDQTKITQSLTESMVSISLSDQNIINTLSDQVIEYLEAKP
jgi:transcriptional regulator NrdR family protein